METTPLGAKYISTAVAVGYITDDQGLKGPHPASDVPRGSPVRLRDATVAGTIEDSFVDLYDPSTGKVTVEPDFGSITPAIADVLEIWDQAIGRVGLVDEKINLALTEHCGYYTPFVLTLVTDGDMEKAHADIATSWKVSGAGTVSKVATAFPHRFARQMLRMENAAADEYAYPYGTAAIPINVVPGDTYYVSVLGRAAVSTLALAIRDESNGADITLDSTAASTTQLQWVYLHSSFTIPSGCYYITPRLGGASATADTYWTALSILRSGDRRIHLPTRITDMDRIGKVYQRLGSEVDHFRRSDDLDYYSEEVQDGFTLVLPPGVIGNPQPPYAEEWQNYPTLGVLTTADNGTTDCEETYVRAYAVWLIYQGLWEAEESKRAGADWRNKWSGGLSHWTEQKNVSERVYGRNMRPRISFPHARTGMVRV